MNLQNLWFVLIVVLWSGYFLLEGFDFGVGMLLPSLPRERGGAKPDVPDDRAGLGRQRGVARHGGRRDLRRVPGLVRDDVLRPLHRAAGRPLLPDHPRDLVRVALEEHEPALAEGVALGERGRELRRLADLGRGLREPALRHADRLERRLQRDLLGPVQRVHGARRARGGGDLRLPRGDLPHAPHHRRPARARGPDVEAALGARGGARRGLPDPDGGRRGEPQRQERLPADPAGGDRDRGARPRRRLRLHAAPGLGVHDDRPRHDRGRRHALHEPLPAGDGLEHRLREQPHRERLRVAALHAPGDEHRRADLRPARPALPGLDVPRVPARVGGRAKSPRTRL